LVLVFPTYLEEVEEIGCRSVDLDEVLVWVRNRIWEGGDCEVVRSLEDVNNYFIGIGG
jgi:hypothetical protein